MTISSSSLEPLFQLNWTLFFEKDLSLCKCRPHRLHRESNLELLKICCFFQTFSEKKQEKLSLVRSIYSYDRFKFWVGWGYKKKGKGVCQIFTLEYIGKRSSQTPNAVKASLSRVESVWIIYGQDKMFNVWCKFIFIWTVV